MYYVYITIYNIHTTFVPWMYTLYTDSIWFTNGPTVVLRYVFLQKLLLNGLLLVSTDLWTALSFVLRAIAKLRCFKCFCQ